MTSPHYFIAVTLPESLKERYAGWQQALKNKLPYRQWPQSEDLHITMKFLGPVDDSRLEKLIQAMSEIERFPAFSLQTGTLGTFGNPKKPRVLWAGVERKHELIRLQENIEKIALKVGFQQEKRTYMPHITLAKKWAGGVIQLSDLKEHYTGQDQFSVNQVVIYRIHPEKQPKYHAAAVYNLSGEAI
ncbi:RNA 2',3'-cyclic phosphodiesterase [Lentibacillus jeotgali]|uniref:RNA 2',3'-cyclic phosphodiesterase n=1 Tax=Lentibacillus jeotgali TaxID=558169 RepID=UPI00026278BC|nr:RNA 2',3'-cyclic phosphodiesterase [Lentibacillus jeotgali]